MAALASVDDVKRVLQMDSADESIEDRLTGALEVAEELVTKWLRRDFTQTTATTEKYYAVKENGQVPLPLPNATITAVRTYISPGGPGYTCIPTTDYEIEDGYVRFHAPLYDAPFEGAVSNHIPSTLARVELDWTPPAKIPTTIRDGTALTAAAIYKRAPIAAGGLTSETLGDYTYSLKQMRGAGGAGDSEAIPDMAKAMMRWAKRRRGLTI